MHLHHSRLMNKLFCLIIIVLSCSCAHQKLPRTSSMPHRAEIKHSTYHRSEWKHWTDKNRDCFDTRAEILRARSLESVKTNKQGCRVITGKWQDYYYPETHTLASKVDIDHLVPLKYAHDHGAAIWSEEKKEVFANDSENLVITNKRYNRQKGAKGIDQWLPVNKAYACKYMRDWIKVKTKYKLLIKKEERHAVEGC
jgi:hypothetical protein